MDPSLFHFAQPDWLWGLAVIPALLALYRAVYRGTAMPRRLAGFADGHLLPHLVKPRKTGGRNVWPHLTVWSLAMACGVLALAGPQWRYTDTQVFKPENDLVIVLDLSRSMNAADVKPSRLARAREEISDLLDLNRGLTIGLVAYAAVPHMVVPLTDDMNTIRALLPSLDTGLITLDGDRLQPAIAMAARMLGAEPGHDKAILVIGDGDFTDTDIAGLVTAAGGARIYTMGTGTAAGAPIPLAGGWVKDPTKDAILIDPLHAGRLQALSAAGGGAYVEAVYDTSDTRSLLRQIGSAAATKQMAGQTIRAWDEGFYVPALIVALLLLPWCRRRGGFLLTLLVLLAPVQGAQAAPADWFRNPEQQGLAAFAKGDYATALAKFTDPYQQGVAAYKAGQYDKAATLFQAAQPGPAARYNLGNAQLMQAQPEAAIKSYEAVLKQIPADADARHNLEIAKKMLAQQQQEPPKPKDDKPKDDKPDKKDGPDNKDGPDKNKPGSPPDHQSGGQDKDSDRQDKSQQPADQNDAPGKDENGRNPAAQGEPKAQQPGQNGQTPMSSPPPQAQHRQGDRQQAGGQPPAAQGQSQSSSAETGQPQTQPPPGRQPATLGGADTAPGDQPDQPAAAGNARRLTQRDLDANQWLNHIQSDPGTFLKNQFMIEEQESRSAPGKPAP